MFQVCYMSATRGSKNQPLKQILLLLEAEASGENAATRSAKLDAQPNISGLHYPCNTIVASTRDLQGGDPRFLPAVRCRSSSRPPQLPPARRRSRTPAASAPAGLASGASVPRHPSRAGFAVVGGGSQQEPEGISALDPSSMRHLLI